MMKRTLLCGLLLTGLSLNSAAAEEEALVGFKVLSPGTALELAQATLNSCRNEGFQIAVAVVDRFGNQQVMLRDQLAGPHTPDTAWRKAWTAVSFRTPTQELVGLARDGTLPPGITGVSNALFVGGGVPVEAAGSIVGGVGVSGAPGGQRDDDCARVGIEAISDKIAF